MINLILGIIRLHFVSKLSSKLTHISSNNFLTQKNRNLKWLSHFWKGSDNTFKINVKKEIQHWYVCYSVSVYNRYSEWLSVNNYQTNKHLLPLTIINVSIPRSSWISRFPRNICFIFVYCWIVLHFHFLQHKVKRAELKCSNIELTSLNKWTTQYF